MLSYLATDSSTQCLEYGNDTYHVLHCIPRHSYNSTMSFMEMSDTCSSVYMSKSRRPHIGISVSEGFVGDIMASNAGMDGQLIYGIWMKTKVL